MKKLVAVFLFIFVLSMGTMFGWGFIDKQLKESESQDVTSQSSTSNATQNTEDPSSTTDTTQQTTVATEFTLSDVAKHKTPSDCWMAISNSVYNVTNYVDMHPGGADIVLMYCGKDATQAYNTQGGRGRGHSARASSLLANYLVGTIK